MTQTDYRNRHHRIDSHFGELPATLVELSSAIGVMTQGMTLEAAVAAIHERLLRLEDYDITVGSIKADSVIVPHSFVADAITRRTVDLSFTGDAELASSGITSDITADSVLLRSWGFSWGSDATIRKEMSGSFTADSMVAWWFTADAVISTGEEEMISTTLGWIGLGEGSLGDA